MRYGRLLVLMSILLWMTGCVSQSRYDDALAALAATEAEVDALSSALTDAEAHREALSSRIADDETLIAQREDELLQSASSLSDALALLESCREEHALALAQVDALTSLQSDSDRERTALEARIEELSRLELELQRREQVYTDLRERLHEALAAGGLELTYRNGRMVLTVSQDLLFEPGEASLTDAGQEALATVAAALATVDRAFQVQGHTDNVPIATRTYPSNWELSSARALTVMHTLIAGGVAPEKLSSAGYGEYLPVADNATPEGRAQNRRVEIVLETDLSSVIR